LPGETLSEFRTTPCGVFFWGIKSNWKIFFELSLYRKYSALVMCVVGSVDAAAGEAGAPALTMIGR
jgi:hypothetical protein